MKALDNTKKIVRVILLLILSLIILFPIVYMLLSSFKSQRDFSSYSYFPHSFTLENYKKALSNKDIIYGLINSITSSLLEAILRVIIIVLASFAFTHLHFKGKKTLLLVLILPLFIPKEALIYQNYTTITALGLSDTILALILPSVFSSSSLVLCIAVFSSSDKALYDASRLDGAGDVCYIKEILIKENMSIVITMFLQTLVTSFNSYLWPLLVTNKRESRTIQVVLSMLGLQEGSEKGLLFSSLTLITIPFLLLLILGKKKIEKSLERQQI